MPAVNANAKKGQNLMRFKWVVVTKLVTMNMVMASLEFKFLNEFEKKTNLIQFIQVSRWANVK